MFGFKDAFDAEFPGLDGISQSHPKSTWNLKERFLQTTIFFGGLLSRLRVNCSELEACSAILRLNTGFHIK